MQSFWGYECAHRPHIWGSYLESYKVIPKRNCYGAYIWVDPTDPTLSFGRRFCGVRAVGGFGRDKISEGKTGPPQVQSTKLG